MLHGIRFYSFSSGAGQLIQVPANFPNVTRFPKIYEKFRQKKLPLLQGRSTAAPPQLDESRRPARHPKTAGLSRSPRGRAPVGASFRSYLPLQPSG